MNVKITKLTTIDTARKACEATMHGQGSNISLAQLAKCEHSPLRCLMYLIEMTNIPTYVSVHLVRHKVGVEHFVKSMREDNPDVDTVADRNTPVNHTMLINAQALIQMARKRLCGKAEKQTRLLMHTIHQQIYEVEEELGEFLIPECEYRNGYCPELKPCGRLQCTTQP